ncbi:MAG: hypothetical protein COA47_12815 [Robiginitomaculum sp.]|nr:MAG: hypothetical protein COA47_12815 [Robiginitomaculum sp.]
METQVHPTLLGSCAKAATAAEAQFRVNYPNSKTRSTRIFALDYKAAEVLHKISEAPWNGAHFLTVEPGKDGEDPTDATALRLSHPGGEPADFFDEINHADVIVLISCETHATGTAEAIAKEAYARKIMIAGLALAAGESQNAVNEVVASLRPYASVLVVAQDNDFVPAMLSALRA